MKIIHKIKPRDGLQLRFPGIKRFLNPAGEFVEWGSYWQRRLSDKDIEIISTMEEEKEFSKSQAEAAPENAPKASPNNFTIEV